jgi:diguanylate cyclase (GGDEF)-like protein
MDGRGDGLREIGLDEPAPELSHPELAPEQRLRGGRAEQHQHSRLDDGELGLEPGTAGSHLRPVRLLVNPPLSARLPLEVLDRVRDIRVRAVDLGFGERLVEQPAGGADERPAGTILLVARLLADEHHVRGQRPFPEHRLRPDLPEMAAAAAGGRLAQAREVQPLGQEACCGRRFRGPWHAGRIPSTGGFETPGAERCCVREVHPAASRITGFTAMSEHARPLRLADREPARLPSPELDLVESYRRLADVFHDVLAEQSLDSLLDRIADALAELIPHDSLTIYEADEPRRLLVPVWARDKWADEILSEQCPFGVGITGWGVEHRRPVRVNQAHLDPRVATVSGTPADEPEALISIPLIARGSIKGALNIYRLGNDAHFLDEEFELAKRFGDAAALALDNAQIRARLEHQAQTDPLTGLYNHRSFHEHVHAALAAASRSQATVSVLMLDIDDFKRVNDVYGHGAGDEVLRAVASTLKAAVRADDLVCRLGGEEFAIVMPLAADGVAEALAQRVVEHVGATAVEPAGRITISLGVAHCPDHAMNPRELITCAEAAMMTAKARGKNQIVVYDESSVERPDDRNVPTARDVRWLAHMKMLQSLGGKLNRLDNVEEIGGVIANELRALVDYHNCRVFVVDGEDVRPIAFVGSLVGGRPSVDVLACRLGEGITGHVALTGESLLVADAANHSLSRQLDGTDRIDESQVCVPLRLGTRVLGVIVLSKLGTDQFDEDDVRLLEVLGGHAAGALEHAARLEAAKHEAARATALLETMLLDTVETIANVLAADGEDAPVEARRITARALKKTLRRLVDAAAKEFDPRVVDACRRVLDETR